jgi:hypothetical protein
MGSSRKVEIGENHVFVVGEASCSSRQPNQGAACSELLVSSQQHFLSHLNVTGGIDGRHP